MPGFGGTAAAAARVSQKARRRRFFGGDPKISAEEALRLGLVAAVCAPEELLEKARSLGRKIARRRRGGRWRRPSTPARGAGDAAVAGPPAGAALVFRAVCDARSGKKGWGRSLPSGPAYTGIVSGLAPVRPARPQAL